MIWFVAADITIGLSLFALFLSILINFIEADNSHVKKEKKSIVETGTMSLFFVGFYFIIRFNIGDITIFTPLREIFIIVGLFMIVTGVSVNIISRFTLGKNWANQIKIYDSHAVVKTGFYSVVRHPLYASLMLMFFGASIVYGNYISFITNIAVFIPFMIFRAKQEEALLLKSLPEYKEYKKEVGMFFPKLKR